jgi:hypothetical protein
MLHSDKSIQKLTKICLIGILTSLSILYSSALFALPDWVKQPILDDEKFIYGIGSGTDFETAKKNALSDIAAKFNANVKESYMSAQRVLNDKISSEIRIDTQVEIQGTRLNHFSVAKSEKDGDVYWVLVQLDRIEFAKEINAHWFKLDKEMEASMQQIGVVPSLRHFDKLKPLLEKNEQLKAVLVQSNFISPRTDFKPIFSRYNTYYSLLNTLLESQFTVIVFKDTDETLAAIIKQLITSKGLKILDDQTSKMPHSVITVSMTKQQREDDRNAFISQVEVYLETLKNNEKIGSNHFGARGRDYDSFDASFEKAMIGIQQQLTKLPLNALLNIDIE